MLRFTELKGSNPGAIAQYVQNERQTPSKEKSNEAGQKLAVGYYSEQGGAPSQWINSEQYGFSGKPTSEQLEELLSGIAPDGTDISRRGNHEKERRMGYDLTFAAPKSVSMLISEDERIAAAHNKAVAKAMEHVQSLAYARLRKGGQVTEYTGSLIAAAYLHEDGRVVDGKADPHLHSHVIIANMTQRSDGQWAALRLDWGADNINQHLIDNIYKSELARELKSLGYGIEQTRDGFEIAGISRDQVEKFSRRSGQIKEDLEDKGIKNATATAAQREAAQNVTRAGKSQISREDQHFEWRQELREAGIDAQALQNRSAPDLQPLTPEQALAAAIAHETERETVVSQAQIEASALKFGMGDVSLDQIRTTMRASPELLDAGLKDRDGTGKTDQLFTTLTALRREQDILSRAEKGKGQAKPIIPTYTPSANPKISPQLLNKEQNHGKDHSHPLTPHAEFDPARGYPQPNSEYPTPLSQNRMQCLSGRSVDANQQRQDPGVLPDHADFGGHGSELVRRAGTGESPGVKELLDAREQAQGWSFSQGQRAAVNLALTSPDRHLGIVGAAGVGKTTSIKIVVEQYKKAGYQVIGVAPTAKAAKELDDAGCEARTLASVLRDKEPKDAKTLYLLDEAGMVSARDFQSFYQRADKEGARTLSVGDPLQLQSVEAGSAFKQLLQARAINHVKIDEIQRQKDPQLKALAEAFSRGDAKRGVELARPYITHVQIEKGENKTDKLAEVAAARYLSLSPQERDNTLLLAATNATRQAINEKVRAGLAEGGELDTSRTVTITALDKDSSFTKEKMRHSGSYAPGLVIDVGGRDGPDYRTISNIQGGKLIDEQGSAHKPAQVRQVYQPRKMELADGDKIMFRQNDKERGIVNGSEGRIKITPDGTAAVQLQDGTLAPIHNKEVMDYSYARTVHSAQGATVEKAIVVGEAGRVSTAESAYVACSREKSGLEIITDNPEKLGKSWSKFSDRQNAIQALSQSQDSKLNELRKDLPRLDVKARAQELEKAKAQEQAKAPEPAPRVKEKKQEMEL